MVDHFLVVNRAVWSSQQFPSPMPRKKYCPTTLVLGESLPRPMLQKKLHHAVPHIAVEHTDLQGSRWHSSYHRRHVVSVDRCRYFLWSPVVTFHHPKCWQGTNLLKHHPNFWHPVGTGLTLGTNSSSLGHNFLSFTLGINGITLGINEITLGTDGITLGINRMTLGINGVSLGFLSGFFRVALVFFRVSLGLLRVSLGLLWVFSLGFL